MQEEESNKFYEKKQIELIANSHFSFYSTSKIKIYDIEGKLVEFKNDVYNSCNKLPFIHNNLEDYSTVIDHFVDYFSNELKKKYKE